MPNLMAFGKAGLIVGGAILFFHSVKFLVQVWSVRPWRKPPRQMDDPIRTALRASPAGDDHIRFEMGRIHLITDSAGPERLIHVVSKEEAGDFAVGVLALVGVHVNMDEEDQW